MLQSIFFSFAFEENKTVAFGFKVENVQFT